MRLRAISSQEQFATIIKQIDERLAPISVLTHGITPVDNSEFGWEATVTFATPDERTRGAKIVRDTLKITHPKIEVDETLLGVTVLASPLQNLDTEVEYVSPSHQNS